MKGTSVHSIIANAVHKWGTRKVPGATWLRSEEDKLLNVGRNKRDLYLPKAKVKSYRNSFLYKSIFEYNSLSKSLKSVQKMPAFIRLCKKELFNK